MDELMVQQIMLLEQIAADLRIILTFVIITFVTSCFRSWRKTVTKGVR